MDKNMDKILAEISAGELIDKITILEIKKVKISNKEKLVEVNKELDSLNKTLKKTINDESKIIKFKVKDSKNFEIIKLDGVKFAKSNGQITASYDKNKIKFDQIIEEVKNNVEILDISTDEGDLEDIFLQVTNK